MSTLIVDASVALKFVTEEPGSEAAAAIVAGAESLVAPRWLLMECGNGLVRKVLRDGLPRERAIASFAALPTFFAKLHATDHLLEETFEMGMRLGHAPYDCLYLVLALREDAPMITADNGFAKSARRGGYGQTVRLLEVE